MKTKLLIVGCLSIACGILVDGSAQESRLLTGRSELDTKKLDEKAKVEREKFLWEKDLHLSGPGDFLPFEASSDNPEFAKDGAPSNAHRLRFNVVQILDKQSFLAAVSINESSVIYWISGVETAKLSDGLYIRIVSPLIRDGIKNYTASGGIPKQVKHFRFQTKEEVEKIAASEKEKKIASLPVYRLASGKEFKGTLFQLKKGKYQFRNIENNIEEFALSEFDEESKKAILKALKDLR